jgi:hypothetical protein
MKYVTKLICINAPEGRQRGTHTNRGTASRPTRTDWLPTNEVGAYASTHTDKHKHHGLERSRPSPIIAEIPAAKIR